MQQPINVSTKQYFGLSPHPQACYSFSSFGIDKQSKFFYFLLTMFTLYNWLLILFKFLFFYFLFLYQLSYPIYYLLFLFSFFYNINNGEPAMFDCKLKLITLFSLLACHFFFRIDFDFRSTILLVFSNGFY